MWCNGGDMTLQVSRYHYAYAYRYTAWPSGVSGVSLYYRNGFLYYRNVGVHACS